MLRHTATRPPTERAPGLPWRAHLQAFALGLLLAGTWAGAHAQTQASAPTAADSPAQTGLPAEPAPAVRTGIRFELKVRAPAPLDALLQRHLSIQRFHDLQDLDAGELRRLVHQLPADAQGLLGTQGYFSPAITTELQPPGPADDHAAPWQVHVNVTPGPVSHIGQVLLAFGSGQAPADVPATPDAERDHAHDRLRAQWPLGSGQPFSQSAWDNAKAQALRSLSTERYLNARLVNSLADVDTDTHTVNLAVELDPGPAFSFGPVQIEGLQRYEAVWMENLVHAAGVRTGAPYRLQDLQAAQQRLAQSGYFDSVFVYVDPDTDPNAAPVQVQVREAQRGKLRLGVGISTDSGPRLSAEHTWNRVPGLDWRATSQLKLESDNPNALVDLRSPTDGKGWQWNTRLMAERISDGDVRTTSQQVRLGRLHEANDLKRNIYLQYDRSLTDSPSLRLAGPLQADASISAHMAWSRNRLRELPTPTQGHGLALEVGAGVTVGSERRPFVRTRARWQGLVPLAGAWSAVSGAPASAPTATGSMATPTAAQLGRIALRLEGGAVVAADDTHVPDSLLFWAGGDQSVRGYSLRDLGTPQADGTLRAGRLLTVGSVEWQRPILSDGQPSSLESTVFADAGAVADHASDLRTRVGVGAGVRLNTPAGPMQLDLAYGLTPKRWRIHFSVGMTF